MLPVFTVAQSTGDNKGSSMGFSFSPDYSFRYISNAQSPLAKFYNEIEKPSFGYTTGFMSAVTLHTHMKFEGGFMFSNKSYQSKQYAEEPNDPNKRSYHFNHYYLDIPLKADYYFLQGKVKLYATAGIQPGIYLTSKFVYSFFPEYGGGNSYNNTTRYSIYRKIQLAVLAGFGTEINLSSRIYLKLEPVFRYNFTTLTSEAVKIHLYSAGINCGIYFSL